jgi:hypothetical protein
MKVVNTKNPHLFATPAEKLLALMGDPFTFHALTEVLETDSFLVTAFNYWGSNLDLVEEGMRHCEPASRTPEFSSAFQASRKGAKFLFPSDDETSGSALADHQTCHKKPQSEQNINTSTGIRQKLNKRAKFSH